MRRLMASVAVAVVALVACGGDDGTTETADTTASTADGATSTTQAGSTTSSSVDGIDPMDDAGTDPVHGEATGEGTALLTDVRVARHEGFDRVVFEFDGPAPEYDVEYVEPPIIEDGSGHEIEVRGDAFLQVTMRGASGFDLTGEGEQVYEGPTRLAGEDAGTSVIQEVVRTGDFEAILGWVIGLSDRVDFRVQQIGGPSRIVVDVRNH